MLENYYKERRTLADFRRGPLGDHFDGFADYLTKKGYSRQWAYEILGRCCLFNVFLIDRGVTSSREINTSLIDPFLAIYLKDFRSASNYSAPTNTRRGLNHLFEYLVSIGVLKPEIPKPVITPYSWMLDPYLKYRREECEISEATIKMTRQKLVLFLEGLGDQVNPKQIKLLRPETIEGYVKKHLKDSPHNLRLLASTLRSFLRFCARQGYTSTDLSGVIPSIPAYRLASLPKGMDESVLQRILNTIPKDTPKGCRDYAIMLLMMAYGIRGKQAAELVLEDLCWPRTTIRIRAQKGGKEVVLPLLESVGEAILRYLRHRPENSFREVFLSSRGPYQPLTGLAISEIVHVYMDKAEVKVPRAGSSTFRHSWAIRALAKDSPMKAIADVLGHRCLDTTFIYAKADLKTLRQVVLPWPEVKS